MKKRQYKIIFAGLIILILILNILLINAQTSTTSDKKLQDYIKDETKISEFIQMEGGDKNQLWEESKNSPYGGAYRDSAAEKLAIKLVNDKLGDKEYAGALERHLISTYTPILLDLAKQKGLTQLETSKGIKVDISNLNFQDIKDLTKKYLNIDLDAKLRTPIKSVEGFGSTDLKWSEKGKNIIGNGKVWLNMETIPSGVDKLEYDEKKGVFVLSFVDGGKLILGEGATNDKGEVIAFSKLSKNLKDKIFPGLKKPAFDLQNFAFLSGEKDGQIILTAEGFELKGNGVKVKYGEFIFGRNVGEKGESVVKFFEDTLFLKGMSFEKQGYVHLEPNKEGILVAPVGSKIVLSDQMKEMIKNSVLKDEKLVQKLKEQGISVDDYVKQRINLARVGNLDVLAKEASFMDRKLLRTGGIMDTPEYSVASDLGKIYFKFDEEGRLTSVKRDDIKNGEWIPVTMGLTGDTYLADIYRKSSEVVQKIISDTHNNGKVDFSHVKERFYSDSVLKQDGREITADSFQKNFLAIIGENIAVGGTGEARILRNLNSIVGVEAENFVVRNGDLPIKFNSEGLFIPTKQGSKNAFFIDEISYMSGGKFSENVFTVVENKEKVRFYDKSEYVVAGREILLGPLESSIDFSVFVKGSDIQNIQKKVEGAGGVISTSRNALSEGLMSSDFGVRLNVNIPPKGVGIASDRDAITKYVETFFSEIGKGSITLPEVIPVAEKERVWKQESLDAIKGLVISSIPANPYIETGSMYLDIRNNPSGNPLLVLSNNGREITRVEVRNSGQSKFVRDILETTTRTTEPEKGNVPVSVGAIEGIWAYAWEDSRTKSEINQIRKLSLGGGNPETYYSIRPSLSRLWYSYLGRNTGRFENTAGIKDAIFMRTKIIEYTQPKK